MSKFFVSAIAATALVAVMAPAPASGITYDKLTYLTFSAPVQVPGATLSAGTYRFRLTDPSTTRKVLQVLSRDGSTVIAQFNTIPDSRTVATKEAEVTFRETPAGVPPAVRSLFYGYEYNGYEFVYPKDGPNLTPEPVAVPPIEVSYTPVAAAPVAAAPEPAAEPAAVAAAEPEPAVEPAPAPAPEPAAQQQAAAAPELPRTASALPLLAVAGFTSLMAGLGIVLLRRRVA